MDYTILILIIVSVLILLGLSIYIKSKKKENVSSQNQPSLVQGFSCIFEGDDKKALEELRNIALSDKGSIEVYLSIAYLYRKLGNYVKSAHIHDVLLGQDNINKEYKSLILSELSKDYLLAGMPQKAIQILDSEKLSLDNKNNYLTYALSYVLVGQYDNAINAYSKYNKYTKNSLYGFIPKCMIGKAKSFNDLSKSLKIVKNIINTDKNCRSAYFLMAAIYKEKGKLSNAISIYKDIISLGLVRDYKDIEIIENAFIEAGEESKLFELTKSIIINKSKNPFIVLYYAKYKYQLGEINEALLTMENYLIEVEYSSYLSKEYAKMKNDKVLTQSLVNCKDFKCKICNAEYDLYSDSCNKCNSYDSIILK